MEAARSRDYLSKTLIYTNQQEHVNIYKAEDYQGHFICIKEQCFLTPEDRDASGGRNQLQKELDHMNVCKIYGIDSWDEGDGYYLSLEIEWAGADLEQITLKKAKEKQAWNPQECVIILYSVINALSNAEQRGVCHRDIKPSNLFLTPDNTYKVGDFGCAKIAQKGYLQHTMAGTPLFLSPALRKAYTCQLLGQDVQQVAYDPFKSDVYSLGLSILYLLKPTVLPFLGNYTELMKAVNSLPVWTELKAMVSAMLTQEEEARPGFLDLESQLPDLIRATLLSDLNRSVTGSTDVEIQQNLYALLRCKPLELRGDVKDGKESIPRKKRFILVKKQAKVEEEKAPSLEPRVKPPSIDPVPVRDRPQVDEPETLARCVKCRKALASETQEWQLAKFGSNNFEHAKQCCSEMCFQSKFGDTMNPTCFQSKFGDAMNPTDVDRTEPEASDADVVMNVLFSGNPIGNKTKLLFVFSNQRSREEMNIVRFYHCQKHTYTAESFVDRSGVDIPSLLPQCPNCETMEYYPFEIENVDVTLMKNFEYQDFAFYKISINPISVTLIPIPQEIVEVLDRGKCHFCDGNLTPHNWRFLLHNSLPAIICSAACASNTLGRSSTCPKCRVPLYQESVEACCRDLSNPFSSYFREQDTYCRLCIFRNPEVWLPCGHAFCSACLALSNKVEEQSKFPCLRCGQAHNKSDYPNLFPSFA